MTDLTENAPSEIWASVAGTNSEGRFGIWDLRKARADNPDYAHYIRADIAKAELDAAVYAEREAILTLVRKMGFHEDAHTATAEMIEAAILERGE